MFSALLISIVYAIIIMELFFDDKHIAVRYLHFSYLALFLGSLLLLIYLAATKSKKLFWFTPAFIFVSLSYLLPFISLSSANSQPALHSNTNTPKLRFLSFSVNSRNKEYNQVAQLIKNNPSDIVCLQEIPYSRYEQFKTQLANAGLKYHHVYSKKRSLMILSKQPITPNKTMPYQQATVKLNNKQVRIWNIHSPKSLTKINYQHYYFDKLYEDISADKTPYKLVCGDFNSTPHNNILPLFMTILQPAYQQSINPISLTYPTQKGIVPSPIPLIKIDYLLFTHNFKIDRYQRLAQYANSDHYPISATASFVNKTIANTDNIILKAKLNQQQHSETARIHP